MASNDEIISLKRIYGSLCRIIEDQGEYQFIITILPVENFPVKIQFFIQENYPAVVPEIYVKNNSPQLSAKDFSLEDREHLRIKLKAEAQGLVGKPMMTTLANSLVHWVSSNKEEPQVEILAQTTVESKADEKSMKKKESKENVMEVVKNPANLEDESPSIKVKLRTAQDVINRILWDDRIDRSCFIVGYLDRFAGLVEEKFNAFCWDQDIAAVDNDTLAIPRHRIQYFMYKQVKVWDKNERLDLFFGSSANIGGIYQFIESFEEAVGNTRPNKEKPQDEDHRVNEGIDSDEMDFETLLEDVTTMPGKNFSNPNRPNFFLGVRITNPEVLSKIREIEDYIIEQDPTLRTCLIPPSLSHITLATVRLNNMAEIEHAVEVIRNMKGRLKDEFPEPIVLDLEKLDNFYQNVLYCKVTENIVFHQFAEAVRNMLLSGRVRIVDNHCFIPHMTLLKISRPIQRQFSRSRTIDPFLYLKYKNLNFGKETVQKLFLCPVGVDRREDGFYQTVMELDL